MSGEANMRFDDYNSAEAMHARVLASASLAYEVRLRELERRARRVDRALQVAIALLTVTSLWLITSNAPEARWGHVLGLASQPFYIAATWRARQWGMFFVAVMLIGIWCRGIANTF